MAKGSVATGGSVAFSDYNPTSLNVPANAKSTDVTEKSETAAPLEEMTGNTLSMAAQVEKRWKKREEEEGEVYYQSPFARSNTDPKFKTKAACQKYMNQEHKNQIVLAKKEGNPHQPVRRVESPKRELRDLVPPHIAEVMERNKEAAKGLEGIRNQALGLQQNHNLRAGSLMSMPESIACQKADLLDSANLQELARMAWSRGKAHLLKKCRAIATKRGVTLPF